MEPSSLARNTIIQFYEKLDPRDARLLQLIEAIAIHKNNERWACSEIERLRGLEKALRESLERARSVKKRRLRDWFHWEYGNRWLSAGTPLCAVYFSVGGFDFISHSWWWGVNLAWWPNLWAAEGETMYLHSRTWTLKRTSHRNAKARAA